MATLNTLRTRFGVVLSAVIAFALLAFVFSLKSEMGFTGNDPVVAEINGHEVTYTEYLEEYNKAQRRSGVSEIDEQQADMLYNATWQMLITKGLLEPGFEELGLEVSDAERMAIIRGEIPTQTLYNIFGDPNTGAYNVNALNSFLFTSQGNPEAEAMWAMVVEQALVERAMSKYGSLVTMGVNVNDLEVAEGVESSNVSFAGRWAMKRYSDIDDAAIAISDAEVKSYYDENKALFLRQPSRTISYTEFRIAPSQSDLDALELSATEVGEAFAEAADIKAFIRESRGGSVAQNYVSEAGLPTAASSALVAGEQYGPSKSSANWTMSRVESSVYASDTLTLSHIVLPYTDQVLADSLLVALRKSDDAAFATAAMSYSNFSESAQAGGSIGELPFSAFTDQFAEALAPIRKGEIVKVESGDMIQLIKATAVGPRVKHYKVATIELPIVASQATRSSVYNKAGLFAVDAKGSSDNFRNAAVESGVSIHNADLSSAMRSIAAIGGSQEVARWAHRAKVGDLSEIFKVDDGYVVARLSDINTDEYSTLKSVEGRIKNTLTNKKKFEQVRGSLSGTTFDAKAASLDGQSGDFEGVSFSSIYVPGLGVEPAMVGAITSSKSGFVSGAIEGLSGVCIFETTDVVESEEPQTAAAERLRGEAMQQQFMQQMLFSILESMADVTDRRGESL